MSDLIIESGQTGLTLTMVKPEFILVIVDDKQEQLVAIKYDGTVIIKKHGGEEQAAKLFWDAVQRHGLKTANDRIAKLEAALLKIQQWDCLNPPNPKLLADLPWIRAIVDEALDNG
jgi:hypothetical protein